MNWKIKEFDELTNRELYDILRLRFDVFVVEQECLDPDLDGKDQPSTHMFLEEDGKIVACLRMIPAGISYEEPSIGRFVVDKEYRKNGIGRKLLQAAMDFIINEWHESDIRISGQAYLVDFYESMGFEIIRGPYLEDCIWHYEMLFRKR